MDIFKLAFETMIVGILSFAWLAIAVDLLFPDFFVKVIQPVWDKNQTSIGVAVLSFAYCLGSAIMPISGQLVNDEHWPFPEFAIRCRVMKEENGRLNDIRQNSELLLHYRSTSDLNVCPRSFWAVSSPEDGEMHPWNFAWRLFLRAFRVGDGHIENDPNANKALTLFQLYESKVLSRGSANTDNIDDTELFRQLHERIVVLRGAVISGTVLSLLCFFRVMARLDNQKLFWRTVDKVWVKTVLGTGLALWFTWFSVANAYDDLKKSVIFDVPILETFLGLTTIFGGFWVIKGVPYRSFLNKRAVFLIVFITLLAYGGWMWSEVIYDAHSTADFRWPQEMNPASQASRYLPSAHCERCALQIINQSRQHASPFFASSYRIRGPTNPVQLRDFCTHTHLQAACSPLCRSSARFGSQQIQARWGQWAAPYPPDAAWNCTISESIDFPNSCCAEYAAVGLRAISTATTLRPTASALIRRMLKRRTPNRRCRIRYRCSGRLTSRCIETTVLRIACADAAHGGVPAPMACDLLISKAACKECCWV